MSPILEMHAMHNEKLDLNLLAVFDSLMRERSVTRAGEQLGLSQSAMSHAVNRLRVFFDDPLFVKTGQGMQPTPKAGATILALMATIRGQVLSQAQFDPALAMRMFTLCMTDMGELVFLPPLIKRLRELAPHCTLRTRQVPLPQVEPLLASGEVDLVLGSLRAAPQGLFQQQLFMHRFVTLVSVKNKDVGDELTLEQFQRMPQIVVTLAGRSSEAYDSALEEQGVKRNIFLSTPHFLVVPLLLDQHPDLIATVPQELGNVFGAMAWSGCWSRRCRCRPLRCASIGTRAFTRIRRSSGCGNW
ncbi:LysR family transcriptional regulator [Achromobacter insolitus]|uniref:LysR family transcriptional regulator n=1 Tax=Achromobacter insolitus TaxID=217204 RepID=UPI003134340C